MYEELLRDAYNQWVDEFEHKAALRRSARREKRELRFWSGLPRLRRRAA
jgi:hypothetical protein